MIMIGITIDHTNLRSVPYLIPSLPAASLMTAAIFSGCAIVSSVVGRVMVIMTSVMNSRRFKDSVVMLVDDDQQRLVLRVV